MQQLDNAEPGSGGSQSAHEAHVEELQRRIEILEGMDESELGEFTRADWVICTLGALVLPALVLLWVGR